MADALSPEVMKLARETACHIYDPYSSKSAHEYVSGLIARALTAERASCQARVEELERERDEAVNWSDIVDRHGTDAFDSLADAWLSLEAIQRVTNAVTSTFSKWADDGLMERFRKHQLDMFHMAFVEGCIAGVKAAEAATLRALADRKEGDA